MKSALLVLTAMLLLGCCSAGLQQREESALANRSFVLTTVDGQSIAAPDGIRPGINFSDKLGVSGVMCNRFIGQGHLQGKVLRVPQVSSTRKMCHDPRLNQWEMIISTMLAAGAGVRLKQNTLTLEGEGHTLVYRAQ